MLVITASMEYSKVVARVEALEIIDEGPRLRSIEFINTCRDIIGVRSSMGSGQMTVGCENLPASFIDILNHCSTGYAGLIFG